MTQLVEEIKFTKLKALKAFSLTIFYSCIVNIKIKISHLIKFVEFRSSRREVFLKKGVLKICSKSTGEHPCRSEIFIEIALWHGRSPVNLQHITRMPFLKKTSERLLLCAALTVLSKFLPK